MNNKILFLLLLSFYTTTMTIGSQDTELTLTSDDEIFIDAIDSPLPYFTQDDNDYFTDAQVNDGYGSDYSSDEESLNLSLTDNSDPTDPEDLARFTTRRRARVVSNSHNVGDSDEEDNWRQRQHNRRVAMVSPNNDYGLHRTNHVDGNNSQN